MNFFFRHSKLIAEQSREWVMESVKFYDAVRIEPHLKRFLTVNEPTSSFGVVKHAVVAQAQLA